MPLIQQKKNIKKSKWVHFLARYGCFSIGVVYVLVGVIAFLSLLRILHGGADEDSILDYIKTLPLGLAGIWAILLGMLGYITWRIFESITDPYEYGSSYRALMKRSGIALSGIAYGLIAYSAIEILLGMGSNTHGQPVEQRLWVARVFQWKAGEWLVGALGVFVAITGLVQFKYVIFKNYEQRLDVKQLSAPKKKLITVLAWAGHFARGIILLVIAYFLMDAAIKSNPKKVVNTDKAFDFLGDKLSLDFFNGSVLNHPAFVLVAFGTICYGFFMFFLGGYYDFDEG